MDGWVEITEDWVKASGQQFARVDGDEVATSRGEPIYRHATVAPDDGYEWLPIVNMDSRPFDYDKDYRLKPFFVRDGERVCRVYPIITKFEHYESLNARKAR
jgi:hypothetical protein